MSDSPVNLHSSIPETVLPDAPSEMSAALDRARLLEGDERRAALGDVAARFPEHSDVWAPLSEVGRDPIEAYAYARVGYHRGLDALRRAGWRGSGYVRWREPTNQGFLRCLFRLQQQASAIGEDVEAERCGLFLRQLDPEWQDL